MSTEPSLSPILVNADQLAQFAATPRRAPDEPIQLAAARAARAAGRPVARAPLVQAAAA